MTSEYIPFISSKKDKKRFDQLFSDSVCARIRLNLESEITKLSEDNIPLWIDSTFDGFSFFQDTKKSGGFEDYLTEREKYDKKGGAFEPRRNDFIDLMAKIDSQRDKEIKSADLFCNNEFRQKPNQTKVNIYVSRLLDYCYQYEPECISVPQIPVSEGTELNKINNSLVKASIAWRDNSHFNGQLILPLIFTKRAHMKGKVEWRPKVDKAIQHCRNLNLQGMWVVNTDIEDWKGSTAQTKAFSSLVEMHQYIREHLPENVKKIAGPYWGLNLVLWSRNLIDYPAMNLGTSHKYYLPGSLSKSGNTRMPLIPLRRLAVVSAELREWLASTIKKLDESDENRKIFSELEKKFDFFLSRSENAQYEIAKFQKQWFKSIQSKKRESRAITLFQDLSEAYALGSRLEDLPADEKPGKKPGAIAEHLMLQCLS
ncbi:hypothetical protein [Gimesia maris]|uniref:hypothetical protein n=1 Tax=Gimesia maris TaxID=122 RepID=UPI003A8F51EC